MQPVIHQAGDTVLDVRRDDLGAPRECAVGCVEQVWRAETVGETGGITPGILVLKEEHSALSRVRATPSCIPLQSSAREAAIVEFVRVVERYCENLQFAWRMEWVDPVDSTGDFVLRLGHGSEFVLRACRHEFGWIVECDRESFGPPAPSLVLAIGELRKRYAAMN